MINNAGILLAGRFEDIDISAQLKEIDINAKGVGAAAMRGAALRRGTFTVAHQPSDHRAGVVGVAVAGVSAVVASLVVASVGGNGTNTCSVVVISVVIVAVLPLSTHGR